ncbi:hypothetical protein AVEN_124920-1 [Araneus ventricosus]|uniref:Uncharacterized protein n=1 Tax=Araneus ventricosus TaxID=182803 RepID=A0A4Y2M3D8_ARAVE|nr:hypothetical protein AVEN_124920-1 [Araneus ventricosus]
MHETSHAVIRLPVHLPDMQPVYFYDDEECQALERAAQRNTMLTAWNMRTEPDEQDVANCLLHLGNGSLTNNCQLGEDIVEIPEECVVRNSIVDESFGSSVTDM